MRLSILCFAFGVGCLQQQALLPEPVALVWAALAAVLLLGVTCWPRDPDSVWRHGCSHVVWPVAFFVFGFCWAGGVAHGRLAAALAETDEGRDIGVVGVVVGLPQTIDRGVRFVFHVEQAGAAIPERISLAWYRHSHEASGEAQPIHVGERWRLKVRLRRPHGNLNPHGHDHERWLLENGIRATGYVRSDAGNQRLQPFVMAAGTLINGWREQIRHRFEQRLADRPQAGILIALAIGDQQAIDSMQWRLFARTGITHLMSISGLHVTMLAGLAYALMGWLWRRNPVCMHWLPAQQAATLAGCLVALGYSLLAGFGVPAQRTLIMLVVAAIALWRRREVAASQVLALALLVVLLFDPWAIGAVGFWLSFGAVGVLFYIATGRLHAADGRSGGVREWLRAQWAITLISLPVLLALFQQFSLVSPLANALAIPLVSFIITPLVLAAALMPFDLLGILLEPAHLLTVGLMWLVAWLASLPWAVWQAPPPAPWAWLVALAGGIWLLLPRGFPARWLGWLALLPLLVSTPERPAAGAARVTVLDVGQGLAVHVQTAAHDLLFDTGPAYSLEADSGNRIIVPYLRASGVPRLAGLVVSHQDNDHAGGAQSVLDEVPTGWLMSSLEYDHPLSAMPLPARPCQAGTHWDWDGVRFEVLHPPASQYAQPTRKSNDMSCVLKVSTAGGRLLIASDIEARTEQALLARDHGAAGLRADVLIVPHHGSRTSSTPEFITAVGAATAIFPVGYRNRFQHPRPDVVERYRRSGATVWRTDRDGALITELSASPAQPPRIEAQRRREPRYWHGR